MFRYVPKDLHRMLTEQSMTKKYLNMTTTKFNQELI